MKRKQTDKEKAAFMLAGFRMAYQIVKDWLPTEGRTGELCASLGAREKALVDFVAAPSSKAGRRK